MSDGFDYVADKSVLEIFCKCTKRDREELLRIFQHLAHAPAQRGDYVQRCSGGRELQVKRFGKWLITFWPDHAVKEMRVVDLKRLAP